MEKYLINPNKKIGTISKDIYGHFSEHLGRCIYDGIFVGEDSPIPNVNGMRSDIVEALRDMGIPVLRWPGGCFADEYHWMDGVGDKSQRKRIINTNWGGVVEDNSFGTHEFMELCRQLDCDAYINGNVGSGTVREMSEWIEYMTFDGVSPMAELRRKNGREEPWKVKYFAVGNENWGCGGNMTPDYYAHEYDRYNSFIKDYNKDNHIYRIACGPNTADYDWTEQLMKISRDRMDALSLHYYTLTNGWQDKSPCLDYTDGEYYRMVAHAYGIDKVIDGHLRVMDHYDPEGKVDLVVDEWGTWHDVEPGTNPGFLYQQSTMRDAVVAGLTLNIFNKHADRIKMANIAQLINVLQAVILTDGEKMLLTPTYYIFKMYKQHQLNTAIDSYITSGMLDSDKGAFPQLIESASMDENGVITSTIVNASMTDSAEIKAQIADRSVTDIKAEIVTADPRAYNDFDGRHPVETTEFDDFAASADGFTAKLPACSIVKFTVKC